MKLTRIQMCVIIMGIALIGIHVVPIAEANPIAGPVIKEGLKHLKDFAKAITKILKSGEINAAHKSMEKAFQKVKENPLAYGLAAVEAADLAKDGVVKIIEIVDSTAYDVEFKINDDNQCLNVYENEKLSGSVPYEHLTNLTDDEVTEKLKKAAEAAIRTYQSNPPYRLVEGESFS